MTVQAVPLEPVVGWPRRAAPAGRYLVTVDLRTTAGPDGWPYAEEEYTVGLMVSGQPGLRVASLGQTSVVVHRFGGTYGPARFVVTIAGRTAEGTETALWLTLLSAGGVPFHTVRLPVTVTSAAPSRPATDVALPAEHVPEAPPAELPSAADPAFFVGRAAAIRAVTRWLDGAGPPTMVVTGSPGSGKSALLNRIHDLARPGAGPGLIAALVDARGQTPSRLLRTLAEACGVSTVDSVDALLSRLPGRPSPVVIVVDAVDETVDGRGGTPLLREVLSPLIRGLGRTSVRLLLGARRSTIGRLDSPVETVDLDDDAYFDPDDMQQYARRCLTDLVDTSPYRSRSPALLGAVAAAIAANADRSFLTTRLVARGLALRAEAVDPHDTARRLVLPRTAGEAMDEDLDRRLGNRAARIREILLPLGYVQSIGLPRADLWPSLLQALTGRLCSLRDLDWLFDHAGFYLAGTTIGTRMTYRLLHQVLAEHLLAGRDGPADRSALAGVVRELLDNAAGRGDTDPVLTALHTELTAEPPAGSRPTGPRPGDAVVPPPKIPAERPNPRRPDTNIDFPWDTFDSSYFDQQRIELRAEDELIINIVADFFQTAGVGRLRPRGIDVGTGRNLYPAMLMLPFCAEITLCDPSFQTRDWLRNELQHANPAWWQFWNQIREGRAAYAPIKNPIDLLSRRAMVVKGKALGLAPGRYDMGTMFFLAEAVTTRTNEFTRVVRTFVNSLTPRSPFAATFVRDHPGHVVGVEQRPAGLVDERDVRRALSPVAQGVRLHVVESHESDDLGADTIVATGRRKA